MGLKAGGVAVMMQESWIQDVSEIVRIDERLMRVKMVCGISTLYVLCTKVYQQVIRRL